MSKPIRPQDVPGLKQSIFPDAVFDVFNRLIAENSYSGSSRFTKDEAVRLITAALDCKPAEVYANGWLNVEDVYREAGWDVVYDAPGYNETYDATYTFEPSERR